MKLLLLRGVALLIAVAALIDPVWTASEPPLRELIAVDLTSDGSAPVLARLEAAAPQWQVVLRRKTRGRFACGPNERCVVIADGSTDADIPSDVSTLSMIAVRPSGSPNLAVRSAVVSVGHAAAAGAVTVDLSREGTIATTEIRVLDGTAVVGSATHKWAEGQSALATEALAKVATVAVPWWPIDTGARTLRIEAVPTFAKATVGRPGEGEATTIDNVIDVGVNVTSNKARVLVFDARPSWNSTFVRRALEDDPRFAIEYRARVAPAVSAGTANAALDASVLEATEAVVLGGPDALTASDVALLERYVTRRGGSLILLPERRPAGPVSRLFGDGWIEQLTPAPQTIGALRATEILRTDRAPITAAVLGRSGTSASIVAVLSGHGRVIISGAMDAWRYRDPSTSLRASSDSGSFDRFWRSLVAEASAAGEALRIDVDTTVAARGERVPFTLRYRTIGAGGAGNDFSAIEARVSARCGDAASAPVRVWPGGGLGEFFGELATGGAGDCQIEATAGNRSTATSVAVADRPKRGVEATLAKLEREARARGGAVVEAGAEAEITRAIDDSTAESSRIVSEHPMRSAWWIIPFAGCLSLEWWIRRRTGLR